MEEKEKNHLKNFFPLIIALCILSGMVIGNMFGKKNSSDTNFLIYRNKEKLEEVLNYIINQYVDTIAKQKLEEAAINSMLDSLDPHSVYIPAEDLKEVNEPLEGKFSGIGIQFNMQSDTVTVVQTIPNGPSEKVGILAGDRIINIDDSLVAGKKIPTKAIVSKLKGKKGTKVKVSVLRKSVTSLIDFEITRDDIPLYSVDVAYMLDENTGYIKINSFSRTTYDEFMEAAIKLRQKGMDRMILDLRSNGGGYMSAAVDISDEFLEDKKLIVYTEGNASPRQDIYATEKGAFESIQLLILVDEWSASASEILSGAVQDNDRGIILGRRTFGKGLVQQQIPLSDGSALRLTIARYYTPTGRSIQKPYNNGKDDYFSELIERFDHGELFEADSNYSRDTMKYVTPGGRILYGGGGIMPDVFVPQDTVGITDYLSNVTNKGLVYKFAFDYADRNRETLLKFKDVQSMKKHLDSQGLVAQFVSFAERNGVARNNKQIKKSEEILITQLKANIARNILDNEGFYPIIHEIDYTLIEALKAMYK